MTITLYLHLIFYWLVATSRTNPGPENLFCPINQSILTARLTTISAALSMTTMFVPVAWSRYIILSVFFVILAMFGFTTLALVCRLTSVLKNHIS